MKLLHPAQPTPPSAQPSCALLPFFGVDVNGFDDNGLRNGTHHVCMNSGWRKKPRYSNHANRSSMSRCVVGSKSSMVVGGEAFFKGLRRSPPRVHARYSSCSLGIVGGGVHSPSKESWTSDSWLSPSPVTSASSGSSSSSSSCRSGCSSVSCWDFFGPRTLGSQYWETSE